MLCVRNLLLGLIAAAALSGGSVAADTKADARTNSPAPSSSYGVIESIGAEPARSDAPGAVVTGSAAVGAVAGQEVEKSASTSARFHIRIRLDDGRYQGFHQFGGDELRVGDRVQIENDRLRRAQEQTQSVK